MLIKYIKSFLWRAAKLLSYTEDARCLKVNIDSEAVSIEVSENTVYWKIFGLIRQSRDNCKKRAIVGAF